MQLTFFAGLLVILCLFLPAEAVPLEFEKKGVIFLKFHIYRRKLIQSYPTSENLIDSRRLFQSTFSHYFRPHLLHVKHKSIQRLLDMNWPLVLPLPLAGWTASGCTTQGYRGCVLTWAMTLCWAQQRLGMWRKRSTAWCRWRGQETTGPRSTTTSGQRTTAMKKKGKCIFFSLIANTAPQ